MAKHYVIEREACGFKSCFCNCGFGEKDPQNPDTIMNHVFQLEYIPGVAKDPAFKKWTGFKKGSYFNPERKDDAKMQEMISRAMMEKLTKLAPEKKRGKEGTG